MEMFFVIGIGIALFIEFLLISKKNKSESDKILTMWMFIVLVHLVIFNLYYTKEIFRVPYLLGLEHPLPLFHGVFLYLYAGSLTDQLPVDRRILAFHFAPAAGMYLYLITFFLLPSEQKIAVYKNYGAGYETFITIKYFTAAISGIYYVTRTIFLLKNHRKNMRDQFSDLKKVNLQWLGFLTIGMGIIWFLVIVFRNDLLVFAGIVIFVFFIGFFGMRQADIFSHNDASSTRGEQKRKYQKSGLMEEQSQQLHQSLRELMEAEAPYRKSDLSISDLATMLSVHPNYLSQIINERERKNFYDFINTYRIEEFKRMIALPRYQQHTLLSLAFDCGFNSKSSFNRYFKKTTGKTPSDYFTELRSEQQSRP